MKAKFYGWGAVYEDNNRKIGTTILKTAKLITVEKRKIWAAYPNGLNRNCLHMAKNSGLIAHPESLYTEVCSVSTK